MVTAAVAVASVARPLPDDPAARRAWEVAATVTDPEIPVLTIEDLGVLRSVEVGDDGAVRVTLTPTYSGCPALDAMRDDVLLALTHAGLRRRAGRPRARPRVDDRLDERRTARRSCARTASRRRRGHAAVRGAGPVRLQLAVKCPRCDSLNTRELARFGSTSCKALYECRDCLEPFDYFKVL